MLDPQGSNWESKRMQKFGVSQNSTYVHKSNQSNTNSNQHQYSAYHLQSSSKNQSNGSLALSFAH